MAPNAPSRKIRVAYWVVTLLFVVPQAWSALQYLTEAPRMVETIRHLGYPLYFIHLLAVAKLAGIAVILAGRPATLKEWAYAGLTFDVLAAFLSHLSVGDSLGVALVPVLFLLAQLASYFLWKRLEGVRPFELTPRASRAGVMTERHG